MRFFADTSKVWPVYFAWPYNIVIFTLGLVLNTVFCITSKLLKYLGIGILFIGDLISRFGCFLTEAAAEQDFLFEAPWTYAKVTFKYVFQPRATCNVCGSVPAKNTSKSKNYCDYCYSVIRNAK